jgi:hypothetical protein
VPDPLRYYRRRAGRPLDLNDRVCTVAGWPVFGQAQEKSSINARIRRGWEEVRSRGRPAEKRGDHRFHIWTT